MSESYDKTIKIWNIQESREECTSRVRTSYMASMAVSGDGTFVVSGAYDKTIKIWKMQEQREKGTFTGHTREFPASAEGRLIVSAS